MTMGKMKDRELIDKITDATIPRIRDIDDAICKEDAEVLAAEDDRDESEKLMNRVSDIEAISVEHGRTLETQLMLDRWNAPLTDITTSLLWALVEQSTALPDIAISGPSLAAACTKIDYAELKSETGLGGVEVRLVLGRVCEILNEVIQTHRNIETEIDGQPVNLWSRTL